MTVRPRAGRISSGKSGHDATPSSPDHPDQGVRPDHRRRGRTGLPDIPDSACRDVPANFFLHLAAQIATKTGDQLASARLVLAWLMTTVGAPAFLTGLLVPIRESLALLPQLAVAGALRGLARRKWVWVAGSLAQGLCALGMAGVAALALAGGLDGFAAGWAIVVLLAGFSLARGVCSVTGKDVLGKTVPKTRRGTLMGYAASVAGVATMVVGLVANAVRDRPDADRFFILMLVAAGLSGSSPPPRSARSARRRGPPRGAPARCARRWPASGCSAPTGRSAVSSSRARCCSAPPWPSRSTWCWPGSGATGDSPAWGC